MGRKKIIFILVLVVVGVIFNVYNNRRIKALEIPENAIRLRILANSDDELDQELKLKVRNQVNQFLYPSVVDVKSKEEARLIIYNQIDEINVVIKNILDEQNIDVPFNVGYGMTDFPTKIYGTKVYPSGEYEALVIELGDAKGDNWWCVLFPPLCLIDITISDGVEVSEDIKFEFFIWEQIKAWLSL